jgi:hypothetical protein
MNEETRQTVARKRSFFSPSEGVARQAADIESFYLWHEIR